MNQRSSLQEAFRDQLARLGLGPGRLLVAVSGGPDSVALLDLLAHAAAELGLELVVGHVDHGIHPDSGVVAARVRDLARRYSVLFLEQSLALGPGTSETVARAGRYRALESMRRLCDADFIATAHHADDQAETVLMRVLRGSGPTGLAGMQARRGRIIRPLLPFRRAELARHLATIGQTAWDDPANTDPAHLRSWVRNELMPLLERRVPDVEERIERLSAQAMVDRAGWDALLDVLPAIDYSAEPGGASVALKALEVADDNLLLCLIMALARRGNFTLGPTRARRVADLVRRGRSGTQVLLGSGWYAEIAFGRLRMIREIEEPEESELVLAGASGALGWGSWRIAWQAATAPAIQERAATTAWFRPAELRVRGCRMGDKLRPLGGRGRRLVVRCMQDARVPRTRRAHWPALEFAGAVVWVPGVCRSDLLMPSPGTEALRVDAELA